MPGVLGGNSADGAQVSLLPLGCCRSCLVIEEEELGGRHRLVSRAWCHDSERTEDIRNFKNDPLARASHAAT
jgi:hypothetical protein